MNKEDNFTGLEIAVIGMAGRFPGASNINEFWKNLVEGRESISFFTENELKLADISETLYKHPNYVNAGAVLERHDEFDADFFNYSPREAEITDPQQRHFLECCWLALEDAGYNPYK